MSWNIYCIQLFNDWVEICIALDMQWSVEICISSKYAMIELKYVLRWNMQWLSWNVYCVGIRQWYWVEIYIALE